MTLKLPNLSAFGSIGQGPVSGQSVSPRIQNLEFQKAWTYIDPKKYILKLRRSLYSLKQAPRIWWERMRIFLLQSGFDHFVMQSRLFSLEAEIAHFLFFYFLLMIFY
jgi:hypothetical protein